MIYQTVTEFDFVRAFDDANRSANFSREARRVLFEYYEDLSGDMGEDIELDPIAICCDWCEYTERELLRDYGYLVERDGMDDDEYLEEMVEALGDRGILLTVEHIGDPDTYLFSE